jgi:hypothetical protein
MRNSRTSRQSRKKLIIAIPIIIVVLGGLLYWLYSLPPFYGSSPGTISVYEENCGIVYVSPSMPNAGSVCSEPIAAVVMPMRFNLSTVIHNSNGNATTLHDVFFGVYVQEGHAIKVSMNSSAPMSFRVYFDNQSTSVARGVANEALEESHLITNQTGISTYSNRILAQHDGVYIFEMTVSKPIPVPVVGFDLQANDLLP